MWSVELRRSPVLRHVRRARRRSPRVRGVQFLRRIVADGSAILRRVRPGARCVLADGSRGQPRIGGGRARGASRGWRNGPGGWPCTSRRGARIAFRGGHRDGEPERCRSAGAADPAAPRRFGRDRVAGTNFARERFGRSASRHDASASTRGRPGPRPAVHRVRRGHRSLCACVRAVWRAASAGRREPARVRRPCSAVDQRASVRRGACIGAASAAAPSSSRARACRWGARGRSS